MNSHAPHEVLGAARWLSPMAVDKNPAPLAVLWAVDALLVGAVALAVLVVAAGMVTP